jgi:hypothetical protein
MTAAILRRDLLAWLHRNGHSRRIEIILPHRDYATTTERSINNFGTHYRAWLESMEIFRYSDQMNCQTFSTLAIGFANILYARQAQRTKMNHWRIGIFNVHYLADDRPKPDIGHAANLFLTQNGFTAWEPQTQRIFSLTETEIGSIYRIYR